MMKSYNGDKGYGFLDQAEVKAWFGRDTFINRQQVDAHDLQVGEFCSFIVKLDKGNPQAVVVCKKPGMVAGGSPEVENGAGMVSVNRVSSPDSLGTAKEKLEKIGNGPHLGIIKSFNPQKGFGFIQCPETQSAFQSDVFLHKNSFPENESVNDTVGREVSFMVSLSMRGQAQAYDVTLVDMDEAGALGALEGKVEEDIAAELADDLEQELNGGEAAAKRRRVN